MPATVTAEALDSIVKPQIERLVPYSPGKPIHEVTAELGLTDVIKLASNENPFGPAPAVLEAIRHALSEIGFYPDAGGVALREKLAAQHGVAVDQVVLGNGSDELLQLAGLAVLDEGDELIIADPTFARYEPQATLHRAVAVKVPLRRDTHDLAAMAGAVTRRTKAIFVANPANPASTYVPDGEVEAFLDAVPENVLVVLDEAYFEFVDHRDHGGSLALAARRPNVLILRTFSKIHALAALRIGYGLGSPEVIGWLHRVREPFNTSSLAQVAALAALDDVEHVARTVACNAAGRARYLAVCRELGAPAVESQANFVLINVGTREIELYERLLRAGIIVRPCSKLGFPGRLRVTVGTPAQVDRFLETFEEYWRT